MTDQLKVRDDRFKEFIEEISDFSGWEKFYESEGQTLYKFETLDDESEIVTYYYEDFRFDFMKDFAGATTLKTLYGPFDSEEGFDPEVDPLDSDLERTLVQTRDITRPQFFAQIRAHFKSNFDVIDPLIDPVEGWGD